jgi:cysteine desulfuration protein SufE
MALCVILGDACNGAPLEKVANLQEEVVFEFFGKNISMGKGQGLMGIINMVAAPARQQTA